MAGERQPPLPLLDTGARSGEEAAEQYPGRAVQYADQLGDHWRPARGGAELLEAAVGPPQSSRGSSFRAGVGYTVGPRAARRLRNRLLGARARLHTSGLQEPLQQRS